MVLPVMGAGLYGLNLALIGISCNGHRMALHVAGAGWYCLAGITVSLTKEPAGILVNIHPVSESIIEGEP